MSDLKVTQTRSAIGSKPKHRGSLKALGLKKIGSSNVITDGPVVRGMIASVSHLVEVSDAKESQ